MRHVLTILAVRDLARSSAFYENALGIRRIVDVPTYAEFEVGQGMRLGLYALSPRALRDWGTKQPISLISTETCSFSPVLTETDGSRSKREPRARASSSSRDNGGKSLASLLFL